MTNPQDMSASASLPLMDIDALPDAVFGVDDAFMDTYLRQIDGAPEFRCTIRGCVANHFESTAVARYLMSACWYGHVDPLQGMCAKSLLVFGEPEGEISRAVRTLASARCAIM